MPSPFVRRLLEEQTKTGRAAARKADPTLGDKVAADKRLADRDAEHPTNIPGTNVPACSSKCRCT